MTLGHENKPQFHDAGFDKAREYYQGSEIRLKNLQGDPTYFKGNVDQRTGTVLEKGLNDLDADVERLAGRLKGMNNSDMNYSSLLSSYNDAVLARDKYEVVPGPSFLSKEIPEDLGELQQMEDELLELREYADRRLTNRSNDLNRQGAPKSDKTKSFEMLRDDVAKKLGEVQKRLRPLDIAA